MATPGEVQTTVVTIPAGGNVSNAVHIGDTKLVGIQFPAEFVGSAGVIQTSLDGSTFTDMMVFEGGNTYNHVFTPPASWPGLVVFSQDSLLPGLTFIRLASRNPGALQTPVALVATASITLLCRDL